MNFEEAASYLHGLTRFGIKLGNDRFLALLECLGNPQDRLKIVHIAGTKGKGSTTIFASSVLRSAGYKVGTYLSPYVYDLRERVQINGEMIPREDFARIVTHIRPYADQLALGEHGQTTEFEYKTAVGFCYFVEQNVDYAVIEVGLGGRLDATNVIDHSVVSVITNIGYDHTAILGDTLELIAGEKAGIIKPNGICVTGSQELEALEKIRSVSVERGARLVEITPPKDWTHCAGHCLKITTKKRIIDDLILGAKGDFQLANAALAVHALDEADSIPTISDEAIREGLATTQIPGRLEVVRESNPTIIVDAAHNEMAAKALAISLGHEFAAQKRPLIAVIGMSKGHDPRKFLGALFADLAAQDIILIATEPEFRAREAIEIAEAAAELGIERIEIIRPIIESAKRALSLAKSHEDTLVLVTGSFYTIGELPGSVWDILTL